MNLKSIDVESLDYSEIENYYNEKLKEVLAEKNISRNKDDLCVIFYLTDNNNKMFNFLSLKETLSCFEQKFYMENIINSEFMIGFRVVWDNHSTKQTLVSVTKDQHDIDLSYIKANQKNNVVLFQTFIKYYLKKFPMTHYDISDGYKYLYLCESTLRGASNRAEARKRRCVRYNRSEVYKYLLKVGNGNFGMIKKT